MNLPLAHGDVLLHSLKAGEVVDIFLPSGLLPLTAGLVGFRWGRKGGSLIDIRKVYLECV